MRSLMVFALLLATALPSRADDVDEAKKQFQLGTMNYDVGQYQQALESFERARALKPLPGFLFNIAQCHRRLGHHDEAVRFFEQYLQEAPTAKNAAEVETLLAEERLAAQASAASAAALEAAAPPVEAPLAAAADPSATASLEPPSTSSSAEGEGDDQTLVWVAIGGGALLVAAGAAVLVAALPAPSSASLGRIDLRTAAR